MDLKEQLANLEAEAAKLRKQIEQSEKESKYLMRVAKNNNYQTVTPDGCHWHCESNDGIDNNLFKRGNYFLKKEHAEAKLKHDLQMGQVERLLIEINDGWEPDWTDSTQDKGSVCFQHLAKQWDVEIWSISQLPTVYFDWSKRDLVLEQLNKHFPNGYPTGE